MLTRSDETVVDCLDTWDAVRNVGVRHAGFKDVGVDVATLTELNRRMQSGGVTTYLEVVSTSAEACLRSARAAVAIGVDRLMGGTQVAEILSILDGSGIDYLPFPGIPIGHPTRLGGDAALVERQCREFEQSGCVVSICWPIGRPRRTHSNWSAPHAGALPATWSWRAAFRPSNRSGICGSGCRRVHRRVGDLRRVLLADEGQHHVSAA